MNLDELLHVLPFYKTTSMIDEIKVDGIEMDSREVKQGSVFVCIPGFTVDGHDFIDDAVKQGAVALIVEKLVEAPVPVILVDDTNRALSMLAGKFFNYPTSKLPLIGVTGTNGKTTVTYLLEEIFKQQMKKTGVIGTIQLKIGEESYSISNTTPDALSLQRTFHKMLGENVDQAIMEVSSHALDMGRVYGCDYDIAVFTNLSQDHLDYHSDLQDYLRAKSLLFSQLGNSYDEKKRKFAILNSDDAASDLLKRSTAQHVMTYGCNNKATVMANGIQLDAAGTSFTLTSPVGDIEISSRLIGMFNVYNMLAASTAAIAANVSLTTIKTALEQLEGVNGRFEPVVEGQRYAVIVDYAHTPDSLENVLQTAREFAKNNVYVVVGCGGDRDRTKRPLMASIAVKYADHAFFTSDNPRTEDPQSILDDMTAELEESSSYDVIVDRKAAISQAIGQATSEDIILIAGKGHETYQIIGHTKYDFDDREVARKAIRNKEKY
ncbi:UDP-N-acetylmuramoyl-L-alanyl-D-glutamate--2,6-diaminopimelate ligase [Oceanobacillus profundus]|uniref:UDP-N-acetylmuramoyl-L-alanyl-D-glutamate--2,6-diaminopimelate ligase n=1 Tax=Oceanobacillus profundus TaxID=372463 RepID=A0A417YKA6_9BACI|nr:UDP-N-acetylmuramoyl-L-alanyl-D-glutamate--2,6-diaminopimelate ligase [Oceanobacillus profundus]MBR3119391.1 UDP-N-acetylmuramoyl-L-alanyl-D-glutamate--2,6-diaminopimelate ligase [Oceanobacillus sp.]MDO6449743.1 UDP-N-acetylmuramoyl-L-alanyl-D-glutamate--2,6-diaminopimelate ligase [Oceanobacillus profundus]PAE30134.1 UDP-N-acetylmuramoyl-L-alanyl-D-glutamate--2,6-diaminopimelate ligase [Paenibacillus sp. 7884-2]RHW33745.1 UDP-N-acetylmuramoyl-L-alanyl-D-glutamate--2,6-diaminopimelate ligase 